MSLTMGAGPLGNVPAGRFNAELPREGLSYVEPSPRRVRAVLGEETVLDSRRAKMLLRHGRLGRHFFPHEDVRWELSADVAPVERPGDAVGLEGHAYEEPRHDAAPVEGRVAFFNEQVDLQLDHEHQPRPGGMWARPGWWRDAGPER